MKSLLLLVALIGVAHADKFPDSGPCDDVDACEKACKSNKKGTCYWGGVLLVQSAVDQTNEPRAIALFERACKQGDAEACWQAAQIIWYQDSRGAQTKSKPRIAYQRACDKNHARACLQVAVLAKAENDPKLMKLAAAAQAKGLKLLELKCVKAKWVRACAWVAGLYESDDGMKPDLAKAQKFRDKACEIETGKPCPPPAPPPPPMTKPHTRPMTKGE